MPLFPQVRDEYASLWDAMEIKPSKLQAIDAAAQKVIAGRSRYEFVQSKTGVPWYVIGLLHLRECDCNFHGCLHNGELIIGNGRVTRLVPAGRGPFETFEASALDALRIDGLASETDWSVEKIAYFQEKFNGFGYRRSSINIHSPYLWAGTNNYQRGKFVSDGQYSAGVVDQQLGVMPILKRIAELANIDLPRDGVVTKTAKAEEQTHEEAHEELKETSRGYSLLTRIRMWLGLGGGGTAGLVQADEVGINDPWDFIHTAATYVKMYGPKIALLAILAGVVGITAVLVLRRMDLIGGRYTPSGQSGGFWGAKDQK